MRNFGASGPLNELQLDTTLYCVLACAQQSVPTNFDQGCCHNDAAIERRAHFCCRGRMQQNDWFTVVSPTCLPALQYPKVNSAS